MMQKATFATVMSGTALGDEPSIVITTSALDRTRDEVVPEGGDFSSYLKNPVVLFGHAHGELPVGVTTHLDVVPSQGVRARWRWLEGDPFADRVRNAFEQGVLRAASIGFVPRESTRNSRGGERFLRWELCEWSLCSVPANPEAVRVLRALGLKSEVDTGERDIVLDVTGFTADDLARLTASASRRRSEPFGDPSRRHRHEEVTDIAKEDLRVILEGVVRQTLAGVIRAETTKALARARGRVD